MKLVAVDESGLARLTVQALQHRLIHYVAIDRLLAGHHPAIHQQVMGTHTGQSITAAIPQRMNAYPF